jgi:hypothetical protein
MIIKIYISLFLLTATCFGQFSWTNQTPAGVTEDIWCVKFADETFVAVTGKGRVLSSTDGTSWSIQTVSPNTWLVSVTYGAGLWVVVGENGSIYYSADLIKWSAAKAVTTSRLNGVAYSGKMFIAVGENGVIATSSDAQTWTLRNSGTTNYLHGIVATVSSSGSIAAPTISSSFLVCGGGGTYLQSTNDGVTWSRSDYSNSSFYTRNWEVLATNPSDNRIVAAGANGAVATLVSNNLYSGNYFPGSYEKTISSGVLFRGLVYGGKSWVLAGEKGTIFTSSDGANWTQRFSGDSPTSLNTTTLTSVEYAPTLQKYIIVGTAGTILLSDSPPTSIINVATRGTVLSSDPLIGGFVISGTAQKKILIRAVGPTLKNFGVSSALGDPVLTVYDSKNKIVATNSAWEENANLTALVAATLRGAFALSSNSKDAALYLTLDPGSYTGVVTSASKTTGTVLFEAYAY